MFVRTPNSLTVRIAVTDTHVESVDPPHTLEKQNV